MDVGFNEDQEMFKKAFRDFLQKECPSTVVRELEKSELGYSPEIWKKMADLDWIGIIFPEKYGGMGGDFIDLAILYEEMGRALCPSPHLSTVVLCGQIILACGTEQHKKSLLPEISKGRLIASFALLEPSAKYEASAIKTTATAQDDDFVINGAKLFIADAHIADQFICAARTKEKGAALKAITLFLVDAKDPGITVTPMDTISGQKLSEVVFDNVKVPKKNRLGKLHGGWAIITDVLDKATVALCAEMVGGAQAILDMTITYSKEREQFGRPVAVFQANSFKIVDMAVAADGARLVTYQAAWKVSEGQACRKEIAVAKAQVSDAYRQATADGLQVHGGYGFMEEYDVQLYFRAAKAAEVQLGDADYHREIVAQEIGL